MCPALKKQFLSANFDGFLKLKNFIVRLFLGNICLNKSVTDTRNPHSTYINLCKVGGEIRKTCYRKNAPIRDNKSQSSMNFHMSVLIILPVIQYSLAIKS